ncbi:MAG: CoB--CoM heterodisulfide reductase iron-sulfur subunit B family protein [Bryobacterales bacterium]|nr:CoB--CoM heterodisulfide reductase iron-sulfur subunit B family protein [Bryobacterales bacterium]
MTLAYYPGCALHGTSNDYEQSVRACLRALGAPLEELRDWICCGATAAHSLNPKLATALPARNLGIAERDGYEELLAPCPMCSMELMKAAHEIGANARLREQISQIVELPVTGSTRVLNLIQVFQRLEIQPVRKLEGVVAACYYGCLLLRPPGIVKFDDPEQPSSMEKIVNTLGAKTVEWGAKTECCGAGLTLADEDSVVELAHKILSNAAMHGANCVVVACPMCHVNLDMKQEAIDGNKGVRHNLPVYYLSDLVGLALGLDENELGIDRHFTGRVHV